jgi:diamine N-acetyltransferase
MTEKITLRIAEEEDVDLLLEWENDPAFWRAANRTHALSASDLLDYLADKKGFKKDGQERWVILAGEEEREVGALDLFLWDEKEATAQVGILIAESEERRNGLALESLKVLDTMAKELAGIKTLLAWVHADNVASQGLFSKASYVYKSRNKKGDLLFIRTLK